MTFTPANNVTGPSTITYSVSDGKGGTSTSTVTVNVGANTPPDSANVTVTTAEDTTLTLTNANFVFTDADASQTLANVRIATLPASGILRLNGVAVTAGQIVSTANVAAGNLTYSPALNGNGMAYTAFTFSVQDSAGAFDPTPNTVTINATPVNDTPVVNPDNATTAINTALPTINVLGNDTDVDGDPLTVTSATVAPAQGTVTINGDGTLNFTPAVNFSGPATIAYTISDGNGGSTTGTLTVNVGANTAPTSADRTATATEDTAVTLGTADFVFIDTDLGQALANVRIDALPASGTLSLNGVAVTAGQVISAANIAAGNLTFLPAANGNGANYAAFTFSVQDSAGAFDIVPNTVTINVTPVNDAPAAVNDAVTTPEDTALTIVPATLLGNDTDVDGNALTITSAQDAVNGTVVLSGGNVVFTPNANYNGPASFSYTVSDGNGGISTATVNITVAAVNDNPVANADAVNTTINVPIANINVLGNDTDVDGNTLSVTSATVNPAQGSATVNANGTINFTPALNFSGLASVTVTIGDGNGGTATSTLTITVGANTPPNSANATATTPEDTTLVLNTGNFVFIDADAGQTLANVRIDTLPTIGTLRLNGIAVTAGQIISVANIGAGNLTYAPVLNGNGLAYSAFTYSVQDSAGGFDTTPNTVTIDVTPVNDAPVANPDSVSTPEDTPLTIAPATLLGNDTDLDADTLTVQSVQSSIGGTVAIVGSNVVFTPTPNFNGPASFTYTVSDGKGGTATSTVSIAVTPVDDPLTANLNHDTVNDTGSSTTDNVTRNNSPAIVGTSTQGDTITLYAQDGVTVLGVTVVDSAGNWSIDPAPNYLNEGLNNLSIRATDPNGNQSAATPVQVVLDTTPPSAPTVIVIEDANSDGTISQSELSGPINVRIVLPTDAKAGDTVQATDGNGVNTFVLTASDIANGNVMSTFANPGEGQVITVSATITDVAGNQSPTNSASATMYITPLVANPNNAAAEASAPLVLDAATLLANDVGPQGRALTVVSVQDAVNGTVALVNGSIVFTPNSGFFGTASFTYTVSDGNGQTSTSSVSVAVLETPTPPIDEPKVYNPRVEIARENPVIDYALHVEHSVNASSAEASLRSGTGVFVTDGATFAELSSETAIRLESVKPAISDGLFVQHAVRNESLVSDPTLFVQTVVRSSQLEALARSVRINSVNSATPGVSTVLDPFANGAPFLLGAGRPAQEDDGTSPVKKEQRQKDAADKAGILPEPLLSKQTVIAPVQIEDSKSIVPNKRRAADGFASQLRQNSLRPDTRSNGVSGARGR